MLKSDSKILIVDDQNIARTLLVKALQGNGFTNIVEAENGRQAYEIIKASLDSTTPIGLVLTDINMPEMDGMQLLQECKSRANMAHVPIVMVTAEAELHIVVQALKVGALDYIKKPVSIDTMKDKIVGILAKLNQIQKDTK